MKNLVSFCLFLVFTSTVVAQDQIREDLDQLAFLNDVMANAYENKHKIKAGEEFKLLLNQVLEQDNSYDLSFEDLKWASIKSPESNKFKIFTWFVQREEDKYEINGLIQMDNGKLIQLNDKSNGMTDVEYLESDPNYWFGALYYNMLEATYKGEQIYLLFGYNPGDEKRKMKVLDVLSFNEGSPVFGKEIFKEVDEEERTLYKHRLLIDYAKTSNVNLNYNESLELIMFDNLISTITPELGPTRLPDGSYKAYKKDGEEWLYVDKVYNHISSTPLSDGRKDRQEGLEKN